MTNQDLRKLRRQDLLEILLEQSREIDNLNRRLREAEEQLKSRQILLEEAGSIAEAALRINGIFEAAQAAAEQYLENVRSMSDRHGLSGSPELGDREELISEPDGICAKHEGELTEGGRPDETVSR